MQGVGYRDALCDEARRRGVTGWVRNRHDGSVEALLQGNAPAVEGVIAWARRGPALAKVDSLCEEPPEPAFDRHYASFERWPSA